jgi:tRNA threonylcarbamoyladenosine biosynthesis protein TsaB
VTILALDLSTPHGQLCVLQDKTVLFEQEFVSDRSHNSMLYGPLQQALAVATPEVIVVGTGPGSYTGVRISIAAAQGIGLSKGSLVLGWSSLTTLADASHYEVLGDARRGMAYLAVIESGRLTSLTLHPVDAVPAQGALLRVTADPKPLPSQPQVQPCLPSAQRLARILSTLPEAEIQQLSQCLLEPHYVQEAFVTQPKAKPR